MKPNGDPATNIRAKVYPGIFEGEYQVTVTTDQGEVHLNVSTDFVEVDEEPSDNGIEGRLKVDIVKKNGGSYIIALPGEVQGAPSRVSLSEGRLRVS